MAERVIFVASGALPKLESDISALAARGNNIYLTTPSKDFSALTSADGGGISCRFTEKHDLAESASSVIDCVEKYGGIDVLVYAGLREYSDRLFLDIPADEFESCIAMLKELYCLCKSALPYMLGRDNAAIYIPVGSTIPSNAALSMYRGACISMAETMSNEFGQYSVNVNVSTSSPSDILKALLS